MVRSYLILGAVSVLVALWIRLFRHRLFLFWILALPGVVLHELAHWIAALVSFGQPGAPHIIPKRISKGNWMLGHVQCGNVHWWNGWIIGLAPLCLLPLGAWLIEVASRSLSYGLWSWTAIAPALLAGECWVEAWPSRMDWQVAAKSWPVLGIIGLGIVYLITR